jgi:uncharacterized membrane protein YphA (DoxX/SURF4 family)
MLTSISLFIMRIGTGMLLVLWGCLRLFKQDTGPGLAEKYYGGMASASGVQLAFAGIEVLIGVLVVLGLFRKYALIAQAIILVGGALAVWKHFLDPFGLYLHENANLLFFPSITVAGAALALIALRDLDTLALDSLFGKRG